MSYGGVSANANLSAILEGRRLVNVNSKHPTFFSFIISSLSLWESESLASYNAHSLFSFCLEYNYFNLDHLQQSNRALANFFPLRLLLFCNDFRKKKKDHDFRKKKKVNK